MESTKKENLRQSYKISIQFFLLLQAIWFLYLSFPPENQG